MAKLTILETVEKLQEIRTALSKAKMLAAAMHSEWSPTEEQLRTLEGHADAALAKLDNIEERFKL